MLGGVEGGGVINHPTTPGRMDTSYGGGGGGLGLTGIQKQVCF